MEDRNHVLGALIKKHHLKYVPTKRVDQTVVPLDVKRYRSILDSTRHCTSASIGTKAVKVEELWQIGSAPFSKALLTKIGHTTQSKSADSDDEADDERQSKIQIVETSSRARPPSSEHTIMNEEIANSSAPSSQMQAKPGVNGKKTAGRELPAPTVSPLSPNATPVTHNGMSELIGLDHGTPPKKANQSPIVDLTGLKRKISDAQEDEKVVSKQQKANSDVTARRQQPPIPDGTIAALSRRPSHTSSRLIKLSDDTVVKEMNVIWAGIRSFAYKVLSGGDAAKRAIWLEDP